MKTFVAVVVSLVFGVAGGFIVAARSLDRNLTLRMSSDVSTLEREDDGNAEVGSIKCVVGAVAGYQPESANWIPCDGRLIRPADYPELAERLQQGIPRKSQELIAKVKAENPNATVIDMSIRVPDLRGLDAARPTQRWAPWLYNEVALHGTSSGSDSSNESLCFFIKAH